MTDLPPLPKLKKDQKQLYAMFRAQRGRCHWCQAPMVIRFREGGQGQPDECTLYHIDSRLNPERGTHTTRRHVAACNACNHRRADEEQAQLPPEALRDRSKRHKGMTMGEVPE